MYDVSCGLNPSLQYQIDSNFLPDGWRSYMARAVKDKFGKPVINAGNYRDPEVVEKVLESGDVDIVGMGRGLIAEPNWVSKVQKRFSVNVSPVTLAVRATESASTARSAVPSTRLFRRAISTRS